MQVPQRENLLKALIRLRNIHKWFPNVCKISQGEFLMLHQIDELSKKSNNEGGIKPSKLSSICEMSKPAVSQMLNSLDKKRYIERKITKEDRRMVYISLTQDGREKLKDATERFIGGFDRIICELGSEDTETLIKLLNKLCYIIEDMQ